MLICPTKLCYAHDASSTTTYHTSTFSLSIHFLVPTLFNHFLPYPPLFITYKLHCRCSQLFPTNLKHHKLNRLQDKRAVLRQSKTLKIASSFHVSFTSTVSIFCTSLAFNLLYANSKNTNIKHEKNVYKKMDVEALKNISPTHLGFDITKLE